ncbi:hypothetical protein SS50377_27971 [Spironucleus salmonicida]|uniref:Uncharacterized protein n=1 Tax=Spironucleus salmonicida TaxID=348837 RepID=V6LP75_9EUKA|nr:hypothetical protein SS50377_27971 [Spironucleus salmonicida]|eukprot:EST42529.1 hypothetical protein SS50377_17842 [Spironucleus salmonicida]
MELVEEAHEFEEQSSPSARSHHIQNMSQSARSDVKTHLSAHLPTEVNDFISTLESAPSPAEVFVNQDIPLISDIQQNYNPEDLLSLYLQDCAKNDYYPQNAIITQLRSGNPNLISNQPLNINGAKSLSQILPKFAKICLKNANLGVLGLVEIVASLTQFAHAEIPSAIETTDKIAQNDLKELEISASNLSSTPQILSKNVPGSDILDPQKPLAASSASTCLLNFNQTIPRLPPSEAENSSQFGSQIDFPLKMRNFKLQNQFIAGNVIQKLILTCKTLVSLNLQSNKLGDNNVQQLLKSIDSSQISYLNVSNNDLTDEFLFGLGRQIENSVVANLVLQNNRFSASGMVVFSAFLAENNKYLEVLDVSENDIGDVGISFLIANFCGCGFASKEVFSEGQKLVFKAFQGKQLTGVFKKLPGAGNGDFKTLIARKCGFGIIGAVQICHLLNNITNIEKLDISGNHYSDAGWYGIMKAVSQRALKAGKITCLVVQWQVFREEYFRLKEGEKGIEAILEEVQAIDKSKIEHLEVVE